jgi:lysophospholipase L1-like esterase
MKYILIGISFFIIIFILYQLARVNKLIQVSKRLVQQTTAFSIIPPQPTKKFLILGDSLGVGVGASSPEYSIAGRLSKDYPEAEIKNLSVSGLRIHGGLSIAQLLKKEEMFDVIFIQLGANDVLHLTSLPDATNDLQKLLSITQTHAKKVIYFNSGSLGSAPLFPHPVDWFYAVRSKSVYEKFQNIAEKTGVTYVDLYYPRAEDPFLKNPDLYYAADSFHVTDTAYELWYQKIKQHIE